MVNKKEKKLKKSSFYLELEGTIYTVETDSRGKIKSREPLDSEVCLKVLSCIVVDGFKKVVETDGKCLKQKGKKHV